MQTNAQDVGDVHAQSVHGINDVMEQMHRTHCDDMEQEPSRTNDEDDMIDLQVRTHQLMSQNHSWYQSEIK